MTSFIGRIRSGCASPPAVKFRNVSSGLRPGIAIILQAAKFLGEDSCAQTGYP